MNPNAAENAGLKERATNSHFSFTVPAYRKLIKQHFIQKIPVRFTEVFSTQRCMEFPHIKYLYNFSGYFFKKSSYGILSLM